MSAADVAEETKADVEAVKSVEDASYPTTASRELSHTKPSFAADADGVAQRLRGLLGEPTSPSLLPTPRHSRKMMRDGFSNDFIGL